MRSALCDKPTLTLVGYEPGTIWVDIGSSGRCKNAKLTTHCVHRCSTKLKQESRLPCSPVGFKGNCSLLAICFSPGAVSKWRSSTALFKVDLCQVRSPFPIVLKGHHLET